MIVSAVNWTMIIPLPYEAGKWDPMESLKILNSSYSMGATDCIWQLGIGRRREMWDEKNVGNHFCQV